MDSDSDLPDVDTSGTTQTDDFGARGSLNEMVDFTVRNQVLVTRLRGEKRKLQEMQISRAVFDCFLLPEVTEHYLVGSAEITDGAAGQGLGGGSAGKVE